jgi:hypothetical protein
MSRSIHSLVSKKATNREVLFNGRLSTFVNPPTHTGDVYVSRDLYVSRDTYLKDLEVRGDLTVLGDSSFHNTDISGNLIVSGDLDMSGNLTVQENLLVYGTISAMQYSAGQVIKTFMFDNVELNQSSQSINGGATSTIFSFNYTPSSTNSYILLEYQTIYTFGGSNSDDMIAKMYVSGGEISSTYQNWVGAEGGGSRSGAIFPIVGRYTNINTSAKVIRVDVINSTDDLVTVQSNNSSWLKITEIGR